MRRAAFHGRAHFLLSARRREGPPWVWLMLENVGKANLTVEQRPYGQQRSLGDTIPLAGLLQMPDHGFMADSKDLRYLPIGLPAGSPQDTVALPVRKSGQFQVRAAGQPSRRLKRKAADQLCNKVKFLGKRLPGFHCE